MSGPTPLCCVVIPALDAETTIPQLLSAVTVTVPDWPVVVVDDGSSDRTSEVASAAGARVVRHPSRGGKGAALKTGITTAVREFSPEGVVTLDADGQHDPGDMRQMLDVWKKTGADMVIGHRRITGTRMPIHRRLSNTLTSFLVGARTGIDISDSQCGFRLMSTRCAVATLPDTDGFEAETEWIIRAADRGFGIAFCPVRTIYSAERSHMQGWKTTRGFLRVLLQEYA